jgi:hypothetical protein
MPSIMVNQAMLNQPTSLSIMREKLTAQRDAGKTRDVTLPARYEGKSARLAVHLICSHFMMPLSCTPVVV